MDKSYEYKSKSESKEPIEEKNNIIVSEVQKQYGAISGEKKTDQIYTKQIDIITQFLDKCNQKDVKGAYELLSDNCKQTLYPSINFFIDGYYNKNFNNKKTYSYQLWSDNTYQIRIRDDILTTGNYTDTSYIQDYYTIDGNKLNINGYINKIKIGKEVEKDNIRINIIDIDFYMDYSICNFQVENNTNEDILLDSRKEESVFYTDTKEMQYKAYLNECSENELKVLKKENKKISLKFSNTYKDDVIIDKISFCNIIVNYNKYIKDELEKEDVKKIEIEI